MSYVQSVLFNRLMWNPASAQEWLTEHGMRFQKIDVKPNHLRFRQVDPKRGDVYRTKHLGESGVSFIIGYPKS